jgi:hypothetical protein
MSARTPARRRTPAGVLIGLVVGLLTLGLIALGGASTAQAAQASHASKNIVASKNVTAAPASKNIASTTTFTCNTRIPGGTLFTTVRVSGAGIGWWKVSVSQTNKGIRRVFFHLDRLISPAFNDVVRGPDSIAYNGTATWGSSSFFVNGDSGIKIVWYDLRGNGDQDGCGLLR